VATVVLAELSGCGGSKVSPRTTGGGGVGGAPMDAAPGDRNAPADGALADARPQLAAMIAVDPTTTVGAIGPAFVGLSYEKSHLRQGLFRGDNAALVALFELLGPSILRVGGNSVDETVWQSYDGGAPAPDASAPQTITAADVDGLAAFAVAAGWKVLYGVNMKLASPSVDADEAAYVGRALGSALYGWEIGNECDLYTAVVASPGAWTYAAFTSSWQTFEGALATSVPGTSFTGPASASHYATWTVPFASDEASAIVLLTQHYYIANGQATTSTIDLLLSPNAGLTAELQALSKATAANHIANGFRLSECNSFYGGGAPGVSNAYASALWAVDFLFANAQNGSSGVNFHGGGNSAGYTPIADANGAVVGARPIFYGMLLFSMAGQGPLLKTTGAPTSTNFSAYAIRTAASETRVVLSNKDPATTVLATVDVGRPVGSATAIRLEGPALAGTTGVTLAGATIGADGSFAPGGPATAPVSGTTFVVEVPPASAALVVAK
jgi:hypothetical protein